MQGWPWRAGGRGQVGGQGGGCGVVVDERGGQLHAELGGQRIPQLHPAQQVQPGLCQRLRMRELIVYM